MPAMVDRGASLVETVIAVTLLGISATITFGAFHTLTGATRSSAERLRSTVALLAARTATSTTCQVAIVDGVTLTPLDLCPPDRPHSVRVAAGHGQSHRHLTMIVDGGP